jgi:hypothetical protein
VLVAVWRPVDAPTSAPVACRSAAAYGSLSAVRLANRLGIEPLEDAGDLKQLPLRDMLAYEIYISSTGTLTSVGRPPKAD